MTDRLLTPQQELFLASYTDPKSDTFGNAYQSALKAKYSPDYAESITAQMPEWLSDNLGDLKRLKKAEKVLDRTLDFEPVGENGKIDTQLLKTQIDVAKFMAETIGKVRYSKRSELTGKDGNPISVQSITGMKIAKD